MDSDKKRKRLAKGLELGKDAKKSSSSKKGLAEKLTAEEVERRLGRKKSDYNQGKVVWPRDKPFDYVEGKSYRFSCTRGVDTFILGDTIEIYDDEEGDNVKIHVGEIEAIYLDERSKKKYMNIRWHYGWTDIAANIKDDPSFDTIPAHKLDLTCPEVFRTALVDVVSLDVAVRKCYILPKSEYERHKQEGDHSPYDGRPVYMILGNYNAEKHKFGKLMQTGSLHAEVLNNRFYMVVRLVNELHVDVNERNDQGATALHHAAQFGYIDILKFLIANGANVNLKDASGFTPMHWAANEGFKATDSLMSMIILYEAGAPIDPVDIDGRTPLDWALDEGEDLETVADFIRSKLQEEDANNTVESGDDVEYRDDMDQVGDFDEDFESILQRAQGSNYDFFVEDVSQFPSPPPLLPPLASVDSAKVQPLASITAPTPPRASSPTLSYLPPSLPSIAPTAPHSVPSPVIPSVPSPSSVSFPHAPPSVASPGARSTTTTPTQTTQTRGPLSKSQSISDLLTGTPTPLKPGTLIGKVAPATPVSTPIPSKSTTTVIPKPHILSTTPSVTRPQQIASAPVISTPPVATATTKSQPPASPASPKPLPPPFTPASPTSPSAPEKPKQYMMAYKSLPQPKPRTCTMPNGKVYELPNGVMQVSVVLKRVPKDEPGQTAFADAFYEERRRLTSSISSSAPSSTTTKTTTSATPTPTAASTSKVAKKPAINDILPLEPYKKTSSTTTTTTTKRTPVQSSTKAIVSTKPSAPKPSSTTSRVPSKAIPPSSKPTAATSKPIPKITSTTNTTTTTSTTNTSSASSNAKKFKPTPMPDSPNVKAAKKADISNLANIKIPKLNKPAESTSPSTFSFLSRPVSEISSKGKTLGKRLRGSEDFEAPVHSHRGRREIPENMDIDDDFDKMELEEEYTVDTALKDMFHSVVAAGLLKELPANSEEFANLRRYISATSPAYVVRRRDTAFEVDRIWQINNPALEVANREVLKQMGVNRHVRVFHGTTVKAFLKIAREGFRLPDSLLNNDGKGPLFFGRMIYFAVEAANSLYYSGNHPYTIISDVYPGTCWKHESRMPNLQPDELLRYKFDSIYSETVSTRGKIWAIPDSRQIIPRYLVKFRKIQQDSLFKAVQNYSQLPKRAFSDQPPYNMRYVTGVVHHDEDFVTVWDTRPSFFIHCLIVYRQRHDVPPFTRDSISILHKMEEYISVLLKHFMKANPGYQFKYGIITNPTQKQLHCHFYSPNKKSAKQARNVLFKKFLPPVIKTPKQVIRLIELNNGRYDGIDDVAPVIDATPVVSSPTIATAIGSSMDWAPTTTSTSSTHY